MLATGALALVSFALFRRGRLVANWFTALVLVLCVATGLLMARTANLGGQVRHTEIGGAAAATTADAEEHSDHEREHD